MKRTLLLLSLLVCVPAAAFAEDLPPAAVAKPADVATVKSVNAAAQSLVVTEGGKDTTITKPPLVSDKAGLPITLDKLTVGQKVKLIPLAKGGSEVRVVE